MKPRRVKRLNVFVLVGTLFSIVLTMGSTPMVWAEPAEESAQMGDQWIKAFLEGNPDTLSALYAKDASFYGFLNRF